MAYKAKAAEYKKETIKDFAKLISEYPIIGIVNMENMPAPQLQKLRENLRGSVVISMTKARLLKMAFEKAKEKKPGVEELLKYLKGMPALLFTKENPFRLYRTLDKNKSKAPAKPGQKSPRDIIVFAGPTSFAPGPIIGELGAAKIKAGIDAGKVVIKEDSLVAKEGEIIQPNIANILSRLGIEPMEIGLDLLAVYENGLVFAKDVLKIDEKEFMDKIIEASSFSFNLAVEIAYPAKDTIELLLQKSFIEAKALALEQNILADAVVEELVGRASLQMKALSSTIGFEVVEKKAEEKKPEEKKEHIPSVSELVQETKDFVAGKKGPSAEDLLKQATADDAENEKEL